MINFVRVIQDPSICTFSPLKKEVDGTVKRRVFFENMCFNAKGEISHAKI